MSLRRSLRFLPLPVAALPVVAVALALVFAAGVTPAAAAPAPSDEPGSIVAARPTTAFLAPLVPLPGRAFAVTYRSTSATGAPNTVSGTLLHRRGSGAVTVRVRS